MYSINNIPLSNFGISPGRFGTSNIALAGHLDMPERIGKTFHDWTGEAGMEPYVLASEIRHGGRSINFSGLMRGIDKAATYSILETFYQELASFTGLVPLVTPWGNHSVFIQEEVETTFLVDGWLKMDFTFEEPVVTNDGELPVGEVSDRPHIDGVAIDALGMFLSGFKDHLNRPETKEQEFTAYQNKGYQITPPKGLEFELNLVAFADSYLQLQVNIKKLQKLLSSAGLRQINFDGKLWEVFNVKGFQVSDLKVAENYAVCRISVPLLSPSTGEPLAVVPLMVNEYDNLITNLYDLIKVNNG